MKWWRRKVRNILHPEIPAKLKNWKKKYETAKSKYEDVLAEIKRYENLYDGDRRVNVNPNKGEGYAKDVSTNVRNITFDLTESEVDIAIPYPQVTPVHEEDEEQAKLIEAFLKAEIKKLRLKAKNDIKERTTPVTGGSFDLVEWDNTIKTHCAVGDLAVEGLHPENVIPQPGVTEIDKMDYIFIRTTQTKDYIKRRFGVDVSEETTENDLEEETLEDIVQLVTVYYRNDEGGIGLFRWVGDVIVEDYEDYEARHIKKCTKCGATVIGNKCDCGSTSFKDEKDEMDHVTVFVAKKIKDESGHEITVLDEEGNPIVEPLEVEIPYYKPNLIPIVLRRNISKYKSFLGYSDAKAIEDQQDAVKKLGSKTNEKTLKAGSFLTLPEGLNVETTDREFKIVRVKNPSEMAMISVLNCQADISKDLTLLETNYQWAKSALGITDAYQGKYDSSATSGAAKQYSINQAAGRLESKREMKNESFAKLYEYMFKKTLACADQPMPVSFEGRDGKREYSHFDKADFLKKDSAGEWYWNDEFLFDIDPTSTLLTNREAMWNQNDIKLQSGAYGQLGDLRTMRLYWQQQERSGYPNAAETLAEVEAMLAEQNEREAMMAQMQAQMPQEGVPNEMPNM